jgi:hypothetical protein
MKPGFAKSLIMYAIYDCRYNQWLEGYFDHIERCKWSVWQLSPTNYPTKAHIFPSKRQAQQAKKRLVAHYGDASLQIFKMTYAVDFKAHPEQPEM